MTRSKILLTVLILLLPFAFGFGPADDRPTLAEAQRAYDRLADRLDVGTAETAEGVVISGPGGGAPGGQYTTPVSVMTRGGTATLHHADIWLHDVVASDVDENDKPLFRSKLIGMGQSAPIEGVGDLAPGTYGFYCSLHRWMTGQLVVADDPTAGGGTDPDPDPDPDPAPEATDWPMYGGDLANSRHRADAGPSTGEVLNLASAWTYESTNEGDFAGTPTVADGKVFMGSSLGRVVALDADTGAELWKNDLNSDTETAIITATAAYHEGVAYFPVSGRTGGDYTPYVGAFDAETGEELWRTYTDPDQPLGDLYGSPTIWSGSRTLEDGTVEEFDQLFIGTSSWDSGGSGAQELHLGTVLAIDLNAGGEILWRTFMFEGGPSSKDEIPVDEASGQQYNGAAVWSTPTVDPETGTVYVGTGNGYTNSHSFIASIVALDAFTGDIVGHYGTTKTDAWQLTNPTGGVDSDFGSSPQLVEGPNGEKWIGAGQKNNHLFEETTGDNSVNTMVGVARYHMLDRESLEPVWVSTVGPGYWLGGFLGSTAYDGEKIYGGTVWGQQVALDKADGSIAWMTPIGDVVGLHHAPTTVANGVVYSADSRGFVQAWDAALGTPLWAAHLGASPSAGGVAVVGDTVYVARGLTTASGSITAFRLP